MYLIMKQRYSKDLNWQNYFLSILNKRSNNFPHTSMAGLIATKNPTNPIRKVPIDDSDSI